MGGRETRFDDVQHTTYILEVVRVSNVCEPLVSPACIPASIQEETGNEPVSVVARSAWGETFHKQWTKETSLPPTLRWPRLSH